MKAIFIYYPQNVGKHQEYRSSGGYRFIDTVHNDDEAWNIVNNREEVITEDDGTMKTDNGRIVWEEGYSQFEFGDYTYLTFDLDKLLPNDHCGHGNMWRAIKREQPWNIDEIKEIVTFN